MVKLKFEDSLRPFIAPTLLKSDGKLAGEALLRRLMNVATERVRHSSENVRRRIVQTTEPDRGAGEKDGELVVQAIIYREHSRPSWVVGALEDEIHQLIIIAVQGDLAALCATDGAMRDRIIKEAKGLRRVTRGAIAAFITGETRAMWLSGVHTPTASKPDSKALTGIALELALDPIGDQTYYWSAARSQPDLPALAKPKSLKKPLVGGAPGQGRLWIRRSESWADFRDVIRAVIDHVRNVPAPANQFAALAQPVDSSAGVRGAYGLAVIPGELLGEDEVPALERDRARRWAFDASFDVEALAGLSLRVTPHIDGGALGTAEMTIDLVDGVAAVHLHWIDVSSGREEDCKEVSVFLADCEQIKIFYESGHTLAQGRCYVGGYSDQAFEWKFASFANYKISREKPSYSKRSPLAANIAVNGDTSLFAYVVEQLFLKDGKPYGWLASDDGSMELADFIHIDPDTRRISIVHVKASSSEDADRLAAPTDYEVVVAQAIKNLRYLDRRNLAEELKRGKGKKIGAAVWKDGVFQGKRDGFLAAAERLPANAPKTLIVLQPRMTSREHARCWGDKAAANDVLRVKQIDTLMLSARVSAMSCGATFIGIGDKGN